MIESTANHEIFGTKYDFRIKAARPNGPWCKQVGYGLVDAHAAVASAANLYIQDQISTDGNGVDDIESVEGIVILSTAVYTVSGQLLQIVDGGLYSTSYLPNGMYILQHRMSDGSVRCEKIANYK